MCSFQCMKWPLLRALPHFEIRECCQTISKVQARVLRISECCHGLSIFTNPVIGPQAAPVKNSDRCQQICSSQCGLCQGQFCMIWCVWCSIQHGTIDILKPLGLSEDACKYTLSPRSERAYSRINSEFDMLFQQLQPPDAKVKAPPPPPPTCTPRPARQDGTEAHTHTHTHPLSGMCCFWLPCLARK